MWGDVRPHMRPPSIMIIGMHVNKKLFFSVKSVSRNFEITEKKLKFREINFMKFGNQ